MIARYKTTTIDPLATLRKKDLARKLGVDPTTVMRWAASGRFPKPFRVSEQIVLWRVRDVAAWMEQASAKAEEAPDKK